MDKKKRGRTTKKKKQIASGNKGQAKFVVLRNLREEMQEMKERGLVTKNKIGTLCSMPWKKQRFKPLNR